MANRLLNYTLSPVDKHKVYGTATLPTEFIKYLRTLFELLDKGNNGYIKISDLEEYWGNEYQLDDSTSNSIIIKRLKEISPGNAGLLSFPRLCSGIKDALLQVKVRKKRPKSFIDALRLEENRENILEDDTTSEASQAIHLTTDHSEKENQWRRSDDAMRIDPSPLGQELALNTDTERSIGLGLKMLDKLKWWYSRLSSQFYYSNELPDLPPREKQQMKEVNNKLEEALVIQSQQFGTLSGEESKTLQEVAREQEERILQLESEKSLLIRELFQLKAQLKSPTGNKNFPLFN